MPSAAQGSASAIPRQAAADLLRASGMVAVVWIHSFVTWSDDDPAWIQRTDYLLRFAVPGFFAVAGFLQAAAGCSGPRGFLARRLGRLGWPYLLASLAALAFRAALWGDWPTWGSLLRDLATGNAWGVYYFVPVLIGASVLGEVIRRLPRLLWPAFALFWVLGWASETHVFRLADFYYEMRSPGRWWGFFLAGWLVAMHGSRISAWSWPCRRNWALGVGALALGLFGGCVWFLPAAWSQAGAAVWYPMVYLLLVGAALLVWDRPVPALLRWLSEASYPIYLYHYFAVALVQRSGIGAWRHTVTFALSLAAATAVVLVGRRVLGPHARKVLG
jgi:peptidoglycan/LPS O-acetylase OafA/YrhL